MPKRPQSGVYLHGYLGEGKGQALGEVGGRGRHGDGGARLYQVLGQSQGLPVGLDLGVGPDDHGLLLLVTERHGRSSAGGVVTRPVVAVSATVITPCCRAVKTSKHLTE